MKCHDFREVADSYLSDELLVETNHDVIRHLESCADCRRELAARRELRNKLRQGFQGAPDLQMNGEFADNLKTQLREMALPRSRTSVMTRVVYIAVAASLIIVAALGFRTLQQRWRLRDALPVSGGASPKASEDRDRSDSAFALSAALAENAVGDHRDCAIHHRLKEKPIDLDEAGKRFDRAYIKLVDAVTAAGTLPVGVELVGAHSCVFNGQRFGHVILKYHGQLVSVLVTNINSAQDDRASTGAHETIGSMQLNGYQLAYFKTTQHAMSVVSSLSDTENLSIAQAIQPSLSRHIRDAERAA